MHKNTDPNKNIHIDVGMTMIFQFIFFDSSKRCLTILLTITSFSIHIFWRVITIWVSLRRIPLLVMKDLSKFTFKMWWFLKLNTRKILLLLFFRFWMLDCMLIKSKLPFILMLSRHSLSNDSRYGIEFQSGQTPPNLRLETSSTPSWLLGRSHPLKSYELR